MKKIVTYFLQAILFFTCFSCPLFNAPQGCVSMKTNAPTVWLNVFVHGTILTGLELFNKEQIEKDECIQDTLYQKVTAARRSDSLFFGSQTALKKGLVKITPTFDMTHSHNKKYAAYPITKMYSEMLRISGNNDKQIFYTFGWDGLLSQQNRRYEAIKLYNALSKEVSSYKNAAIRIRLLTHSHGGNVGLNLAAIKRTLEGRLDEKTHAMHKDISQLPRCEYEHELYAYRPTNKNLFIDELIMLGTPIQEETECFAYDSIFGHIYHFYSRTDIIQRLDKLSSSQSKQRFEAEHENITQVKMMFHARGREEDSEEDHGLLNLAQKILNNFNPFKKPPAPSHAQMWFMLLPDEEDEWNLQGLFEALPIVVFTPLFIKQLKQFPDARDVDIDFRIKQSHLLFNIFEHNKQEHICFGRALYFDEEFSYLPDKLRDWKTGFPFPQLAELAKRI
ncbi:MAG: hypothetical protein H6679_00525 [Epsilonproteobacteria bacterium]|nr:hypothetical protein [Campylobacterota bacterium]